jgi:hypothetical protein
MGVALEWGLRDGVSLTDILRISLLCLTLLFFKIINDSEDFSQGKGGRPTLKAKEILVKSFISQYKDQPKDLHLFF